MGNGAGTRSTLARMSARRYNGASGGGASSASKSGSKRQSRPMTQADIERKSWADAVPSLRERAERMAQQPIGDVHSPRSTITLQTPEKVAELTKPNSSGRTSPRQREQAKLYSQLQAAKAVAEAGPDKATLARYERLNSPEGKAVRTTIRDTMLQLEVARAQTRAEKFGTQAYTKAKAREQALGAKLKAANAQYRLIESGKAGKAGKASGTRTQAAKTSTGTRSAKSGGKAGVRTGAKAAQASTTPRVAPRSPAAQLVRLGGEYERANQARDYARMVAIDNQIKQLGAKMPEESAWWLLPIRGRNIVRAARGLEAVNL